MVLSIKPYLGCNINCTYCFEADYHPHMGSKGNQQKMDYDLDAMLKQIERAAPRYKTMGIHGGEPTAIPIEDMRKIFQKMKDVGSHVGIQTNASLINDAWISLFKEFHTSVGVSFDGPGELNSGRGFFDATGMRMNPISEEYTKRVQTNIYKMKDAGISVSIIVVLNRFNGINPQRQKLKQWLLELREHGIKGGRLNLAFVNDMRLKDMLELTSEEQVECWSDLADFVLSYPDMDWLPFREMVDNLLGFGLASCHYTGCDPMTTEGEVVVGPDGEIENCSRLQAPDGTPSMRRGGLDGKPSRERTINLRKIPMAEGGCGGCKYWGVCFSGCPAEGWNTKEGKTDYYSKTRECTSIQTVYGTIDQKLHALLPNARTVLDVNVGMTDEQILLDAEKRKKNNWNWIPLGYMSRQLYKNPSSYKRGVKGTRIEPQT